MHSMGVLSFTGRGAGSVKLDLSLPGSGRGPVKLRGATQVVERACGPEIQLYWLTPVYPLWLSAAPPGQIAYSTGRI